MLIQIRISSKLKEKLDRLVNAGLYPDLSACANVALENLVVAEDEHSGTPASAPVSAVTELKQNYGPSGSAKSHGVFGWKGTPVAARQVAKALNAEKHGAGHAFPLERWLFGQRNRVFPLKANSRLLLSASGLDGEPLLGKLVEKLSQEAANVGAELMLLDESRRHKKEDLYSTGFPAANSDKSRQRFADQFLTSENGKGEVSGMLTDWKLAVVEHAKDHSHLYPTEACVAFADLPSPLFDRAGESPGAKFSDAELTWALNHVTQHVPVEAYAFRTLLRGIETGSNDPTKLDLYLRREQTVSKSKTTDDFVATQRAGAISRMVDLDLLRRIRNGVRISYVLTPRAEAWLDLRP